MRSITATSATVWRVVGIVAAVAFAVGLVLLILGAYVPLPGWLGRWNDPTAWEPIAIQVVLGVVAFGAWAWPHRHGERAFSLVFLALGTLTVLVLGTAGYLRCPDATLSAGWSTVSRVVGLLIGGYDVAGFDPSVGGGECGPGVPLALQFARLVAVLVLLGAASRAVAALFRGQLDRILVRIARRIVLVVGADETSASLLPALAADRRAGFRSASTHVIVTPDPAAPWVRRARGAGWRVVTGDASDVAVLRPLLRRGRKGHALRHLAALPADSTSTQRYFRAVERAISLSSPTSTSAHPVTALLRIDDSWQAEDWRRRYLGRAAEWIVDTISADEVTARLVVEDALRSGADRLVVVGGSSLTFAVLAEIAQQSREHAVLGEPVVPEVVVLDPDAWSVLAQHEFSQRRFGNASGLRASALDADATTDTIVAAAKNSAAPAILFTGEPGTDGAERLAARLGAEAPGWLVESRLAEVAGLGAEPLLARVYAYGSTLDAGGRPVGNWERIARLGHERYVHEHPDPDIPSRRPWNSLDPFYRASNVRQVLTTLESAVAVGRSWGAGEGAEASPSAAQLERMAQLEHESWRTHLLENRWRQGETRDDAVRRHPDLLPWDALTDEARAKTRDGVISSLELLATLGYRSFDEPEATWRKVRRRGVVFARPRDDAWTWTTHDGQTLRGAAGDWEVFDSRGHTHSVSAAIFETSHKRIDGDRWRRVGTVQVRPAREGERIATLEGELVANAGEWVVRGDLGEEWIISTERLAAGYEARDLSP